MDSAWLVSGATVENRSPRDRVVRTVFSLTIILSSFLMLMTIWMLYNIHILEVEIMNFDDKKSILKTVGNIFMVLVLISLFVYAFSNESIGWYVKITSIVMLTISYICYALISLQEKWFILTLIISWLVIIFWVF